MLLAARGFGHVSSACSNPAARRLTVEVLAKKKGSSSMPKGVKKENLPTKVCVSCQRPFTWRKVWERCWDEVQTCSDRCKAERKKQINAANRAKRAAAEGEAGETVCEVPT